MRFTSKKQSSHSVDLMFTITLFLLFVITGIGIVLVGSKVYSSTATEMEEIYTSRTALSYLSEKIHQSDSSGAVELVNPEGFPEQALVIHDTINDITYDTFIYFYDGSMRELMVKNGTEITPEQGAALIPLQSFTMEKYKHDFYIFSVTEKSGKTNRIMIRLHSN